MYTHVNNIFKDIEKKHLKYIITSVQNSIKHLDNYIK